MCALLQRKLFCVLFGISLKPKTRNKPFFLAEERKDTSNSSLLQAVYKKILDPQHQVVSSRKAKLSETQKFWYLSISTA